MFAYHFGVLLKVFIQKMERRVYLDWGTFSEFFMIMEIDAMSGRDSDTMSDDDFSLIENC